MLKLIIIVVKINQRNNARVAELVDAVVSKATVERRVGSSPTMGTNFKIKAPKNMSCGLQMVSG